MKSNPMISALMALLFINAAGTALLAYQYVTSMREVQTLQPRMRKMQQEISMFTSMVKETINYKQTHNVTIPALNVLDITYHTNRPAAKLPNK